MFARHTEKCRAIISPDSDGCDSSKLMGLVQRQTRISTMLGIFWFILVLKDVRQTDL